MIRLFDFVNNTYDKLKRSMDSYIVVDGTPYYSWAMPMGVMATYHHMMIHVHARKPVIRKLSSMTSIPSVDLNHIWVSDTKKPNLFQRILSFFRP